MSVKVLSIMALVFYMIASTSAGEQSGAGRPTGQCRVVEEALSDRARLRPGLERAAVEKLFIREGGFQTAGSTRYAYAKCRYIHVDVDFDLRRPDQMELLPNDTVSKVSQLYISYETKD